MILTAKDFIEALKTIEAEFDKSVPKIKVFNLAKDAMFMPVSEVIQLLKNKKHDLRVGAVSILDWKARDKKVSVREKEEVYLAYIQNHDWIDDWGLVDRAAPYVVGGYLFDKDKKPLYDLAHSMNPMERRTAIVATYYFIRQNQIEDTFQIAEILVHDEDIYVQKAVGSWIREAGKRDENRLKTFLDKFARTMPRITLQYAVEKLNKETKQKYLSAKKDASL